MSIVRVNVNLKVPTPPTEEQIRKFKEDAKIELAKLENFDDSDIIYDEDCPPLTDEELDRMERVHWTHTKHRIIANA